MIEAKGEDILFGTSLEMKLQCQCHSKTVSLQFIPKPRCQIVCFKKSVWDDLQFDLIPLDTITSWGLWGTGVQLSLSITLSRSIPMSPYVLVLFKTICWDHLQFDLIPLETITSWWLVGHWGPIVDVNYFESERTHVPRRSFFFFKQSVWDDLQLDLIPPETITSW